METFLTEEDKKLIWSNNWRLKEIRKKLTGNDYLIDLVDDCIDSNHEILDFTTHSHVDNDALPNPIATKEPEPITKVGSGETIIVFVGHNKNTGARSITGVDEWSSRNIMGLICVEILKSRGFNAILAYRNARLGYTSAMRKHGDFSKMKKAIVSVEIHFNIGNGKAEGSEIIVASEKTQRTLGKCFGDQLDEHYPNYNKRGDNNGCRLLKGGRGFGFNKFQPCPSGVYELFFADTPQWYHHDEKDELKKEALFLADVLTQFAKNHTK